MCGAYPQVPPGQRPPAFIRGIGNEIPQFIPNPNATPNPDQSGANSGGFIVNPEFTAEAKRRTTENNRQIRRQGRRDQRQAQRRAERQIPPPPPPPPAPPQTQTFSPIRQEDLAGTAGGRRPGSGGSTGRGALVIPIDLGGAGGGHSLAIPT